MKMYLEADVDTAVLGDRQVAILGYGSQGRAHALNLKDSGFNVVVGLRKGGASWPKAEADGLTVMAPNAAVAGAAVVMFLTPDMVQKSLYQAVVERRVGHMNRERLRLLGGCRRGGRGPGGQRNGRGRRRRARRGAFPQCQGRRQGRSRQ